MNKYAVTVLCAMLLLGAQPALSRSELSEIPTVSCIGEKVYTPEEIFKSVNESARAQVEASFAGYKPVQKAETAAKEPAEYDDVRSLIRK